MARRRVPVLPAGVDAFERTAQQWRQLGAPSWVFEPVAACEAYVTWGWLGCDPDDPIVRHYALGWMARCVKPQYLAHADALSDVETQLLAGDRWATWGRPGRCRSPMLEPDAAGVPAWLACCRAEPRRGPA